MRNLLFISHFFPPTGGAGVQRSSKFVKYLPAFGFAPYVLTSTIRKGNRWTPEDKSLTRDVSAEVTVRRLPDEAALQVPNNKDVNPERARGLVELGLQAARETNPELIYVSLSPFGDYAAAAELAKQLDIPWVADLRDPWALDEFQVHRSILHRHWERKAMRTALASARCVIMNTPTAAQALVNAFPEFRDKQVFSLTNGFDEEDFAGPIRERATLPLLGANRFSIVHTGTFHTSLGLKQRRQRWLNRLLGRTLRSVEFLPRSPYFLLKALQLIQRSQPEIFARLEVVFAGMKSEADRAIVLQSGLGEMAKSCDYLSHEESIDYIRNADLLFLPMHKLPAGTRSTIVPGKTYEYLASGRPILAAVPAGDARDFVEASGRSYVTEPDDWQSMAERIVEAVKQSDQPGSPKTAPSEDSIRQFERRRLSKRLAQIFETALDRAADH